MAAVRKSLERIFYPRSLAVVGTNNNVGTVPCDIFMNLTRDGFTGTVYPVSPGCATVGGIKAHRYVSEIAGDVDLAILVFPNPVCHMALEQCGQKGIPAAIVISAGFREVGEAGAAREAKLKEIADKYGIALIGPNCLGVINTDPQSHLNASFARKMPEEGSIGFLSQSGALCTAVLDYARGKHIGFSKFVSFGNKADVTEMDLLRYLKDDPKTRVILMYLEEIRDGRALMETAREVIAETGKPILAIKSGRTSEGAAAAASHTGSLAGSDDICEAALRQAGIIRCTTIEEMFNIAIAFAYQPMPRGKNVAIVTNAGGPGVLATDAAIGEGLLLAKFADKTTEIFKESLPKTANIKNPVDVIGDARADRYEVALSGTLEDENVDGTFVILTPQSMTDIEKIAEEVCAVAERHDKPLYASFMGETDVAPGVDILQRRKIPHYILPESMCRAFARVRGFAERAGEKIEPARRFKDVDRNLAQSLIAGALDRGQTHLPEEQARGILEAYSFPLAKSVLAATAAEAGRAATEIGFPVALKIISEDVIHKSDSGGVVLNVGSAKEAQAAFGAICASVKTHYPQARIQGVLVQKMVTGGIEAILGLKRDPCFGPVIMFGLGGIFVEIFRDVAFRIAPIGPREAQGMVREARSYPLLTGARGRARKDIESLVVCIQRLSQLAMECPEIRELDVNPLMILDAGQGCCAADVRMIL